MESEQNRGYQRNSERSEGFGADEVLVDELVLDTRTRTEKFDREEKRIETDMRKTESFPILQ